MNHLPFLDACRKLAAIFATLGCFEQAYSDFATLEEQRIQQFGTLLQSVIISICEQHVVRVLRTHSQILRVLC